MKAENDKIPRNVRRHAGFLWRDLCDRYPAALRMSANQARQVGSKTQRERRVYLRAALRRLCELGFFPPTIDALKPKHIAALCRDMESRGLQAATIATDVSKLTVLCRVIGKPQLVRDVDGCFTNPLSRRRSGVARRDKSLEGSGLEFPDLYRRAFEIDPRVACMLELCHVFGLRAQESWLFRPHMALQENMICVFWGTKGGRKRQLPFAPTDEHRKLIEKAAGFAATSAESMLPRGMSMNRWKPYWQRVMTRLGMTRNQLGVTPHSLRHSMLCRFYRQVSGHEPPVCGGELNSLDPFADRAARDLTADPAGHGRPSVTSAYIGGVHVHARDRVRSSLSEPLQSINTQGEK